MEHVLYSNRYQPDKTRNDNQIWTLLKGVGPQDAAAVRGLQILVDGLD